MIYFFLRTINIKIIIIFVYLIILQSTALLILSINAFLLIIWYMIKKKKRLDINIKQIVIVGQSGFVLFFLGKRQWNYRR